MRRDPWLIKWNRREEMAHLFEKQARVYAESRPSYPPQLFSYLASLTPAHNLAWDVGTGNGQAAVQVSEYYKEVIATDLCEKQLLHAEKRPNITYKHTPCELSEEDVSKLVGPEGSVDLIVSAQAVHWMDLDIFFKHATRVLKKPGGVIAVWCYLSPIISPQVDVVSDMFDKSTHPYWDKLVKSRFDDKYQNLPFPFEPVLDNGMGTGPIEWEVTMEMTLQGCINYYSSWSPLQTARSQGIELLSDEVKKAFKEAWGSNENEVKVARFPIFMRVGRVG